jgi:hypothetical protein
LAAECWREVSNAATPWPTVGVLRNLQIREQRLYRLTLRHSHD